MDFRKINSEDAKECADNYLKSLCGGVGAVYAAFRLACGSFYEILDGEESAGVINVNGGTLNALMLKDKYLNNAHIAFAAAKNSFNITSAAAYPNDYYILTAASQFRPRIEPLALTYEYRPPVIETVCENTAEQGSDEWLKREIELSAKAMERTHSGAYDATKIRCARFCDNVITLGFDDEQEIRELISNNRIFVVPTGALPKIKDNTREVLKPQCLKERVDLSVGTKVAAAWDKQFERAFIEEEQSDIAAVGIIRDVPYSTDRWDIYVYVAHSYRRMGIGSKLLEQMAKLSLDYGHIPSANVRLPNEAAVAALKKADFVNTVNTLKLVF